MVGEIGESLFERAGVPLTLAPGIVWVLALLVAVAYALRAARRCCLNPKTMYGACVIGLFFGLWGGHLLGMFYYGTDGRPWAWLRFWSSGQAQYGGLVVGAFAVALFVGLRKLPLAQFADAVAPSLALGVSIGRIGCFLNGDDYGSLSQLPWAVRFAPGTEVYSDHVLRGLIGPDSRWSLPVHPVQLYCSLFWLGLFTFLVLWNPHRPGLRFSAFLMAHGTGRVVEQLLRGDFQPLFGPLSLTQLISLFCIALGAGIWLSTGRRPAVDVVVTTRVSGRQSGLEPSV